jgi:hypothetical protein
MYNNSLQEHFETFRKHFSVKKCYIDRYNMTYLFTSIYAARKSSSEANLLIERLKLPLVAIHNANCYFFTVQSNEHEN